MESPWYPDFQHPKYCTVHSGFFCLQVARYTSATMGGMGYLGALSLFFAIAPIFIFRRRGGVARGKSYVKTTRLVDTSLYAILRHPQYFAGILFNLALMLLAQHWLVVLLGVISMLLIYRKIQAADQDGIEKFGYEYRQYMQRVPQINFILGIYRVIRNLQPSRKA